MDNKTKTALMIVVVCLLAICIGLVVFLNINKEKDDISLGEFNDIFTADEEKNIPNSSLNNLDKNEEETMKTITDFNEFEFEIKEQGTGIESVVGDTVVVHYEGFLTDGTKFDSSYDRGSPFQFTLGEQSVISGWEEGVKGMKVGEKRELRIPSSMGYGASGAGNTIPPYAGLIFNVELLEIK